MNQWGNNQKDLNYLSLFTYLNCYKHELQFFFLWFLSRFVFPQQSIRGKRLGNLVGGVYVNNWVGEDVKEAVKVCVCTQVVTGHSGYLQMSIYMHRRFFVHEAQLRAYGSHQKMFLVLEQPARCRGFAPLAFQSFYNTFSNFSV